jgi:hypothetical protein
MMCNIHNGSNDIVILRSKMIYSFRAFKHLHVIIVCSHESLNLRMISPSAALLHVFQVVLPETLGFFWGGRRERSRE